MNDQQFVNAYIRILNDTVNEAINKNIVMQAQLEVAKQSGNRIAELESKVSELSSISTNQSSLQQEVNNLRVQLEQSNAQLNNKTSHLETFKRELIDARNILKESSQTHQNELNAIRNERDSTVKTLNQKIDLLSRQLEELTTKKQKKDKKSVASEIIETNLISVSDGF